MLINHRTQSLPVLPELGLLKPAGPKAYPEPGPPHLDLRSFLADFAILLDLTFDCYLLLVAVLITEADPMNISDFLEVLIPILSV